MASKGTHAAHPIVDVLLGLLGGAAGGPYQLAPAAADRLKDALSRLAGTPEFVPAVRALVTFAYMLETQKGSPAAARAILGATEAIVGAGDRGPADDLLRVPIRP